MYFARTFSSDDLCPLYSNVYATKGAPVYGWLCSPSLQGYMHNIFWKQLPVYLAAYYSPTPTCPHTLRVNWRTPAVSCSGLMGKTLAIVGWLTNMCAGFRGGVLQRADEGESPHPHIRTSCPTQDFRWNDTYLQTNVHFLELEIDASLLCICHVL